MTGKKEFPAPWELSGKGYILLFKFPKSFVREQGFIPGHFKGKFCGGFGAVMLVDYVASNVGPYRELLFIPGKFRHNGLKKNFYSITKIYVSTEASVYNGRKNWGIPKEIADFEWNSDGNRDMITVTGDKKRIFEIGLENKKFKFPITTRLYNPSLLHKYEQRELITRFIGSGKGSFAKVDGIWVNDLYFPGIPGLKPLFCVKIDPFKMTFQRPKVL